MLKLTQTTVTTATMFGYPATGPVELLQNCKTWLAVNWEGEVEQVLVGPVDKIDRSWFQPSDKGGLGLFGVDAKGKVICGAVLYSEGKEKSFEVVATKSTQTHPWD